MKKTLLIPLVVTLAFLCGCKGSQTVSKAPVRYVDSIITNPHIHEYAMLGATSAPIVNGDIAIFDTPERCLLLSEAFMESDKFDNLDGVELSDGLPDFAGERIAAIMDDRYAPYAQYLGGREDELRELAARGFVAAADTLCCMAAFDTESRSHKPQAKAVVLSSALMAAYGLYDVDTLARRFGCSIPVFSPVTSMIAQVLDTEASPVSVVVLASEDVAASGAYQSVFAEMAKQRGDAQSQCSVFAVNASPVASDAGEDACAAGVPTDIFRAVLDSCRANGLSHISALLVDDYALPVASLEEMRSEMMASGEEADIMRRQVMARGFRVVDPRAAVVADCYHAFRNKNIFTHNIAYPMASAYITSPESQSLKLMDFDESLLPDSLHDFMLDMAPKTHKSYVQNQHFAGGN